MLSSDSDTAILGTGIIGIATAYYLAKNHGATKITLIDEGQPMAFTSAQSGENYRNWWPHPTMVAFTNRSIDLLEEIARSSGNRINMNRRGYALATRRTDIDDLIGQLLDGLGDSAGHLLRYHDNATSDSYAPFNNPDWESAPIGVDILRNQTLIRDAFPNYDPEVESVIHIRRCGDISGQQLGIYMLEYLKEAGAERMIGEIKNFRSGEGFEVELATSKGLATHRFDRIVNAAGPFADKIAAMLGVDLPVYHTFQQKIAFEDREEAIPRKSPFSIDLDEQQIDWSSDEREMLLGDSDFALFAETMSGAIHCRPDGGDKGNWIKLGWAYNEIPASASRSLPLDESFPEIVLRGAARLRPALKAYYGRLPRNMHHYGGWYTMTEENWPLIGKMGPDGAYMNCAMSGFGTMAACAAGELCAAVMAGAELPGYAEELSMDRYKNPELMAALRAANKGVL